MHSRNALGSRSKEISCSAVASNQKTSTVGVIRLMKRSYRWRWFGNKGVILVLFWNFSVLSFFDYISRLYLETSYITNRYYYFIGVSAAGIFFPIVGWLTDVYLGRYKAIRSSLLVLWCGAILWCLLDVLTSNSIVSQRTNHFLAICIGVFVSMFIGCFLVSIVQFCVDQLQDSSSEEIISFCEPSSTRKCEKRSAQMFKDWQYTTTRGDCTLFSRRDCKISAKSDSIPVRGFTFITWYFWTYNVSKLVAKLHICISSGYMNYTYSTLYISVLLTLAVSFDFLFNHWSVKEPVTQNPLKLIFKVLQFILKNKYPQQLSALAYWDSNRCSRIDLAKSKYGGPYTTGQVEDVKAFFQIHCLIFIASLYFTISFYCGNFISPVISKFYGFREVICAGRGNDCLKIQLVTQLGYLIIVLCIPAYEFLIRPVFWKWIPQLKIVTRIVIGSFFVFAQMAGLISVEVVGYFSLDETNATEYCNYFDKQLNCNAGQGALYYWLSPLSVVYALGQYFILAAGVEYLCAKTPYSMRGLIFGSVFTCLGLSLSLLHTLFFPFSHHIISIVGVTLGCVFWFLVTCTGIALLLSALLVVVNVCCYRKQDNLETNADDAGVD